MLILDIFEPPWRRKTGRRHQHVLQHATHAKVHVRDMARLVRQVSLTAESINPLETPPYFLAVDQPSLAMDGLASTYICAMWQCWKSWSEPIPQAFKPNGAPWGFTAIDSVDCMFGYRVFWGIGWNYEPAAKNMQNMQNIVIIYIQNGRSNSKTEALTATGVHSERPGSGHSGWDGRTLSGPCPLMSNPRRW